MSFDLVSTRSSQVSVPRGALYACVESADNETRDRLSVEIWVEERSDGFFDQ